MKIKIYSKTTCPFCIKAKQLLNSKHLTFEEVNLDRNPEQTKLLIEKTNYRKVPQIFIDDKFIGGYTELAQLDKDGKL